MILENNSTEAEIYKYFSKFIEDEVGIVYRPEAYFQLKNRLEALIKVYKYSSLIELYNVAKNGLPYKQKLHLLDLSTNNETSFFRDRKSFEALEKHILPTIVKQKPRVRIWSMASSSGQEAYSVAILLENMLASGVYNFDYEILGTDISEAVLEKADSGIYSDLEVNRGLNEEQRNKYLKYDDSINKWCIKPYLKEKVKFHKLNLIQPFYFAENFDLVLCRNVLIYQNNDRKKQILKRVDKVLSPNGYLVMGSGETLIRIFENYISKTDFGSVYYLKPESHSNIKKSS